MSESRNYFENIFVVLAENPDALVPVAVVGVLDYIGAGFVYGKHYLALLLRGAIEEPAELTYHRAYDDEEFGIRGNPDFNH